MRPISIQAFCMLLSIALIVILISIEMKAQSAAFTWAFGELPTGPVASCIISPPALANADHQV